MLTEGPFIQQHINTLADGHASTRMLLGDTRFAALWLRHGYNISNGYGGALDWDGSEDLAGSGDGTLTLYNTLFTDNVVNDSAGSGGAVAAFYGASVHVERSTFRNNRVEYNGVPVGDSGADGGGGQA